MSFSFLLTSLALLGTPRHPAPPDTTQTFKGFGNFQYAWGALVLHNGKRLDAFVPSSATGLSAYVPYYLSAPTDNQRAKIKLLAVDDVRLLRVRGQRLELLKPSKRDTGVLGARRVSGAVEVFVVKTTPLPTMSFLGATPVLSNPASTGQQPEPITQWYLRRSDGTVLVVEPTTFAQQVSAFLADDAELARQVATSQPGYGPDDLEQIMQRYNQRAAGRK